MKKYLSIIVSVVVLLFGAIGSYYTLVAQTNETAEDVEELKEDVEENEDKIVDNEKIDIEQSILLKQIAKTLGDLNDKIDKD